MKSMVSVLAVAALAGTALATPVIDGSRDLAYGGPLVVQNTQTQFGDSNSGDSRFANGSELDAGYARVEGGVLYLFFAGNLEANFNKLEIFIDSRAGGQNVLRGDNPNVDFNGLNRMAGLQFDAGFSPDFWLSSTGGNVGGGQYGYFLNYAELATGGGGAGYFVGGNDGNGANPLNGGNNPFGIQAGIDNSNIFGVDSGGGAFIGGAPSDVDTGMEFAIPLSAIGAPGTEFCIRAFINGGGHDFVSNQLLGGINGGNNLGEPSLVNLTLTAGTCFTVVVPTPGAAALMGLAGLVGLRRRR
ncbi:MAG: MYXO-CTERM sorting domain-containing protein [Phycisphaerales bacterium]